MILTILWIYLPLFSAVGVRYHTIQGEAEAIEVVYDIFLFFSDLLNPAVEVNSH